MRTCIEVEANFKAILKENIFTPIYRSGSKAGQARPEKEWNINDFKKVNKTHHLDEYLVELPFWKGNTKTRQPFKEWKTSPDLSWYKAYNQSKHDRFNNFEQACFGTLIDAYSGLCVLLSSQFRTESFSPGSVGRALEGHSYYHGEFGLGEFLMVQFPDNWTEDEIYDFNWSNLSKETKRFEKIDYNNI